MASLYTGGLWCPQCGEEYRPGFAECADCGVPLVDVKPTPARDDRDHGELEYDLDEWPHDRRAALELLLLGADVPHAWEGTHLVVGRAREREVDALVEQLEGEPVPDEQIDAPLGATSAVDADVDAEELAGPGRRLLGSIVDGLAFSAVTFPFVQPLSDAWTTAVCVVLVAAYDIVGVALWGQTLGKLVVRTRVVLDATSEVPGWWPATVRWAVQAPFAVVALVPSIDAVGVVAIAGALYPLVVYGPILWDRQHQGLHDKAAGTVVVRT
ncbi:MAG TPA: RDD family protein [Acidimicrobiales bacterium]|nr:RDD family protein [Acidimicrobiales bacterium]